MKGVFITFEGPDGAGKTTQLNLLANHLQQEGYKVLCTREPGGTPLAEDIRRILLSPWEEEIYGLTEVFLYAASRVQHVKKKILPALAEGKVVLCDRFTDSTLAYQGYGRGIELELLHRLNDLATGGLKPAVTLLLDLPPEEGLRRGKKGGGGTRMDRLEQEDLTFHYRVRQGFLALARQEPRRIKIIDARQPVEKVFAEVLAAVSPWLWRANFE
ncbi:thymidylate kinase [Thermanaeromonas toyohensis ToBE]|uniref:Thymidylate kinase n=1 Tax=Thermanaeromonas toyohensis ToBE TaxID=698762 RepID=A0A1W1V7L1_9FIRM|nr:dTMP kinase [Thermanaeromonas toyohensis]SMB89295.1 thymidylate kinase [Thermanaeromonas toyohensis ToBE]